MASNESNTLEDHQLQIELQQEENQQEENQQEIMPLENCEIQTETEMENNNGNVTLATSPPLSSPPQRSPSYRGVHLSHSASEEDANANEEDIEDPWWSEVENGDLLLDQVPNVTSVFTPTPEAICEQKLSPEDESVLDGDFDRLHKIADKIKMTLSEHAKNKEIEEQAEMAERERKLSESSDKESKTLNSKHTDCSETDCSQLAAHKEQSLEEFKEELRTKRLQRQDAVQNLRDEIAFLRRQLEVERDVSRRLRRGEHVEESFNNEESSTNKGTIKSNKKEENTSGACALNTKSSTTSTGGGGADDGDTDDEDPLSRSRHANIELANAQLALQMANSENISLRGELGVVQKQVLTLKEVIACCKQMLAVKEEQCNELKQRLTEIEKSFAEHEMKIMSDNLRQEYERQLVNIRQLRQLYEERQRVAAAEYENLQRLISIKRDELAQEQEKTKGLEERNQNLMKEVETANNELACLRDECKEHKFEKSALKEEIGAVNTLFSQMVMGFNGKNNLDIDRLTTMLEENRTLLNDMATKECTDGATLPKLLFELVEQATTTATATGDEKQKAELSEGAVGEDSTTPTPCTSAGKEVDNVTLLENEKLTIPPRDVVDDDDEGEDVEGGGEEEGGATSTEEDVATVNDNENVVVASLTSNIQENEMPSSATACSASSHDDVDDVAASKPNEKVIVATQNKLKKHHHHRKLANNKKSTTSSNATTSSSTITNVATMKFHDDAEVIGKITSAQEIIGNLPKVWRVLMELLSHHKIDPVKFEENGKGEDCYKSVETPNGPKAELSVSKTYIKLKDLILEKKSLVKETNRLKTLNCHLDYRLNEQEKRLSAVSLELTKTWHLVGKMQRQHRQLHTQEQILRYQLQQKRRLLTELKDELEYCRRKWAAARAKNDESQEQCNDLRREFARRKLEDANNSAESGYSDSGGQASDEEVQVMPTEEIGAIGGGAGVVADHLMENVVKINDEDDEDDVNDAKLANASAAGGCVNYRRKRLREMFEHTRKIKRMQSTSPGRADCVPQTEIVVLRWNSAPPTCGWRDAGMMLDEEYEIDGLLGKTTASSSSNACAERGAIPKTFARVSRKPKRRSIEKADELKLDNENEENDENIPVIAAEDRSFRILRLEEQCKTLIKQVLETSDNRERLEVQLKRFQDEMSPVQYAVPLEELINKKRIERMTRASSLPLTGSGSLTPREEEYTRKRSERLERLEEESRQLLSRIKRTSDRGHYLRCSLDRIRRAPASREGSFESNTEEVSKKPEEEEEPLSGTENNSNDNSQCDNPSQTNTNAKPSPLTADEEAYTARRAARLQRLEEESKQLLTKLSNNSQRGDKIGNRLDNLHERYKSQDEASVKPETATTSANAADTSTTPGKISIEQRIENIDKISSNREERLRILEEEGRQLINRLSETSERGTKMINRIAERELIRQRRATPTRDNGGAAKEDDTEASTSAAALLPALKNVACSSIVSEELTDRVTITTIPSQIAAHKGAIPKTKPTLQLLASRPKSSRLHKSENKKTDNANESLEDMIKRLQSLPFPGKETETKEVETTEQREVNEDEKQQEKEIVVEPREIDESEICKENVEDETNKVQIIGSTSELKDKAVVKLSSESGSTKTSVNETPANHEEAADNVNASDNDDGAKPT